jgi:hypothetical protein
MDTLEVVFTMGILRVRDIQHTAYHIGLQHQGFASLLPNQVRGEAGVSLST